MEQRKIPDYHFLWKKIKGSPLAFNECYACLLSCYNCLVSKLLENTEFSKPDLCWCNKEISSCFKKVSATLTDKPLSRLVSTPASCQDIIRTTKTFLLHLEQCNKETSESLVHAFQSLIVCTSFIWLLHLPQLQISDILSLFQSTKIAKKNDKVLGVSVIETLLNSDSTLTQSELALFTNTDLVYLQACKLYDNGNYDGVVQFVGRYLSQNTDIAYPKLPLLYNILACSHAALQKLLTAITILRKALDSKTGAQFVLPLVYNLILLFSSANKLNASIQTAEMLLSVNDSCFVNSSGETPHFTFHMSQGLMEAHGNLSCSTTNTPYQYTMKKVELQYLVSKLHFLNKNYQTASMWYNETLKSLTTSSKGVSEKKTVLPLCFPLPSVLQVQVEELYANERYLGYDVEFTDDDLSYCVTCFKKTQITASWEDVKNGHSSNSDIKLYNDRASQLLYCLCKKMYAMQTLLPHNLHKYKQAVQICLCQLEDILPFSDNPGTYTKMHAPKSQSERCQRITASLSSLKAKIYFNYALACCSENVAESKHVLKLLQSALEFDLHNLPMRWNATLLLWQMGLREEAMKTWCKTRGITYGLTLQELNQLTEEKEVLLSTTTTSSKKDLLVKDFAVLKELTNAITHKHF